MRIHRHRNRKPKFDIPVFKTNERITAPQVRVLDADGTMRGVLPIKEAIQLAKDQGLDLIEVSPKADPPVCKILDHGSFKYQKVKEAKKQRAKSKEVDIKGIRLSLRIGKNDLDVRRKQASKFLEKGNKIRVEMILRGREKAHRDRAKEVMDGFVTMLGEDYDVRVEQPLKQAGGRIHMIIARTA